ncbi:MAG: response regulator [Bacteroidota bacterium]
MDKINILICDDHQLVVDGLKNTIALKENLHFSAAAGNGEQAVKICDTIKIHLVLMDIDMPVMNGIEATLQIKKKYPGIKILVLSMHDEPALIKKVMDSEADGYLLKNSDQEELLKAIDVITGGKKYFSEEVIRLSQNKEAQKENFSLKPSDTVLFSQLTDREKEILKQIAEGLSNKEIGDKLFISHRTVDTHRTNLMKKLDVHNIAGLIRFAIKNGLAG